MLSGANEHPVAVVKSASYNEAAHTQLHGNDVFEVGVLKRILASQPVSPQLLLNTSILVRRNTCLSRQ